jgi:hypothetical protein
MLTPRNNRQIQRIPVALEAKYRDKNRSFIPYVRAELTDIHHQGCRLLGSLDFKRGAPVSIVVDIPHEGPMHMEGTAAWTAPVYKNRIFETGVQFKSDDPADDDTYMKLFHFCLLNRPRQEEVAGS